MKMLVGSRKPEAQWLRDTVLADNAGNAARGRGGREGEGVPGTALPFSICPPPPPSPPSPAGPPMLHFFQISMEAKLVAKKQSRTTETQFHSV